VPARSRTPAQERGPTVLERAGTAAAGISEAVPSGGRSRAFLQWGLAALIFSFLVFFVLRQWSKLPNFDWRFSPGWLGASAVAIASFYVVVGEIWRLMLRALGAEVDPREARAVWGKSLLARYVPTNMLMVVGRVVMAERLGVRKRVTLASVAYELGLTFGTAIMVGAYFVINLPPLEDQPARYAVLGLIPLVLAVLHPRVFGPLADLVLRKLGREPLPRALSFPQVIGFTLAYIGCWATIGAALVAFALALHPLDAGDVPYVAAAYPVAYCVAVLTFVVPSGLGTRDVALATAMAAVLPGTVATAIAVAFRIFQTAIELLYVAVVVTLDRRAGAGSR
jgi:glycosyltransferase 2 family protein